MECALKINGIQLELLPDVNMILGYENSIIEGITRTICHYAEANDKYMHGYDKTKKFMHFIF